MQIGCFGVGNPVFWGVIQSGTIPEWVKSMNPGISGSGVLGCLGVHTGSGYSGIGSRTERSYFGVPGSVLDP